MRKNDRYLPEHFPEFEPKDSKYFDSYPHSWIANEARAYVYDEVRDRAESEHKIRHGYSPHDGTEAMYAFSAYLKKHTDQNGDTWIIEKRHLDRAISAWEEYQACKAELDAPLIEERRKRAAQEWEQERGYRAFDFE